MIPASRRLELERQDAGRQKETNQKGFCGKMPLSAEGRREPHLTNRCFWTRWETWPLGGVAGASERARSSPGSLLTVLWPTALMVTLSSLPPPPPSPTPPRSPPICTRTTTTYGLSRSIIRTQVMQQRTDASSIVTYSEPSSTFLMLPKEWF